MFAITSAGQTTIKTRNRSNGKNLNRPGWKEFASELYDMHFGKMKGVLDKVCCLKLKTEQRLGLKEL